MLCGRAKLADKMLNNFAVGRAAVNFFQSVHL